MPSTTSFGKFTPSPWEKTKAEIEERKLKLKNKTSGEELHSQIARELFRVFRANPQDETLLLVIKLAQVFSSTLWMPGRPFPLVKTTTAYYHMWPNAEWRIVPGWPLKSDIEVACMRWLLHEEAAEVL